MPALKLPRLEDRTPIKLAIAVTPQLHADLQIYAGLYRDTYGTEESIADLVPSMLAAFLGGDRAFVRAKAQRSSSS